MKITTLTFCFAFALTMLSAQEQYMKSVVRITAQIEGIGEETGAGIIIGKESQKWYVATARHVVDASTDIVVQVHGIKAKYKATLIHQDAGMDAAVLEFFLPLPFLTQPTLLGQRQQFSLTGIIPPADPEIIVQKAPVKSIGHPGGGYWTPNLINVVQQKSLYEDARFFSITPQAIVGGCSGGPVFLESGQWLGMITETGMVQAKCLKAETLANWLKTKGVPSNFITPPAFIPEMVRIVGHKKRASSFFITEGFDEDAEVDDYDYDFSKGFNEVKSFSIGKYEVTLREFEAFVAATGYITSAEKKGYSNGIKERDYGSSMVFQQMPKVNWRHNEFGRLRSQNEYNCPVIHVSWEDADAYCKWLSRKTGKKFRLPTSTLSD